MSSRFLLIFALLLPLIAGCQATAPDSGVDPAVKARIQAKWEKKARPDSPRERHDFFLERRLPAGEKILDMERYFAAEKHMRAMPRHEPGRPRGMELPGTHDKTHDAPGWEWVGPGNIAGRTRSLVFHPDDPDVMFAAGVSGGVWRTTNGGESWVPLSDDAVNLNIGVLVIDPENADVLYAGTGELYRNSGMPWSPMTGAGILKSSDGGETWNRLLATEGEDFLYVSDIVFSPHDSRRLYAATNTGVWRSTDAGATFQQVLRPANEQGLLEYEGCNDLLIRDDRPGDWLLASCSSRSTDDRYWLPNTVTPAACSGPCPAAVFLNRDAAGAGAWEEVLSEAGQGRTELAAFRGDQSIMYASAASLVPGFDRTGNGTGDYDNGLHAVFRSDDGGRTWQARLRNDDPHALSTYLFSYADGFEAIPCEYGGMPFTYSAGWYNQAIAVDPMNPDIVWVAGMDIYRSNDGGRTFGMASHWFVSPTDRAYVHADQHLFKFHPDYNGGGNRTLYVTNDGGVHATSNARAAVDTGDGAACGPTNGTIDWHELNSNLGTTQFYDGMAWPDGKRYVGGTQDNGTLLGNDGDGPGSWRHIFGGDGGVVAIHPNQANTFYVSYQNGNIFKTTDGGNSFTDAANGLNDVGIFIMPYVLDPNNPERLYAGGLRLWRTGDGGQNWNIVSEPFGGFDFGTRVSALAVADGAPNRMLVGNRHAIFFNRNALSSTSDTTWQSRSPRSGWVSALKFDPDDPTVVYATYSTFGGVHVWKTTNGGRTWKPLDGTGAGRLPDVPVHDIVINPDNTEQLYIGTDLGLFVSLDGGQTWAVENTGFANVIVESLHVSEPANGSPILFAFTYGRGVWRVELDQLTGKPGYRIGAGASGLWYNPSQDGHGMFFEVIEQGGVPRLLASWYVYLNGEQVWLTGVGTVEADRAVVPLSITSGGDFPPDFDPGDVTLEDWGELEIEFESVDRALATWSSNYAGFNDGEVELVQLAPPVLPRDEPAGAALSACHSASWYDPDQNGHGFQLQVVNVGGERHLVVVWYVYHDGGQAYLVGSGPIENDAAEVELFITEGGDFPPAFDPDAVNHTPWGTATFTFDGPDSGNVEWETDEPGFSDGSLEMSRLTTQLKRRCD